jgi:hypothetical protein
LPWAIDWLKETNYTMSLRHGLPLSSLRGAPSPSSSPILLKSALPTPMIIIEQGSPDRSTIAAFVSGMSQIWPSVSRSII